MPIKIKKSKSSKKNKRTQSQKQTVIVNIDKRRRARNPKQDLLKEQSLKLEQLKEISKMRSPEFNDINIKLDDLKKEREASLKREEATREEAKKIKAEEDKKQALFKEEEKKLNMFKEEATREATREEKEKVNFDIMDIKKRLEEISKYGKEFILNKEQEKEKEFIEAPREEEEPKNYIKIPKSKKVNLKFKINKPEVKEEEEEETKEDEPTKKKRQITVTRQRLDTLLASLDSIPESIILDIRTYRNTGRISKKLKDFYRNRN